MALLAVNVPRSTLRMCQLSLALCCIFFAFFGMSAIEQTALADAHASQPEISEHAGYYSQTLIYAAFIFSNLLAPPFIGLLGCRWSMVIGSACYTLFETQFLYINNVTLYGFSALSGTGGGLMWTAAGVYLAKNSTPANISRHSSIMWMQTIFSELLGGVFLLCVFGTSSSSDAPATIDASMRRILFGTFAAVSLAGNIIFALLRPPAKEGAETEESADGDEPKKSHLQELLYTFRLLPTVNLLLLALPFALTGIHTAFFTAIYPTSLGATSAFALNSKAVVAMNNIAVGSGEALGCLLYFVLGRRLAARLGGVRWLLAATAVLDILTVTAVAVHLPPAASLGDKTAEVGLIGPSEPLAVACGVLLGVVDALFHTQLYAFISTHFERQIKQTNAIFMFYHAALTAAALFGGTLLSLPAHAGLIAGVCVASAVSFFIVERRLQNAMKKIAPQEHDNAGYLNFGEVARVSE